MSRYELVLRVEGGEPHAYPLNGEQLIIGRSNKADIIVDGDTVSRYHARVWVEGGDLAVEDLGSRNGVKINGQRVHHGLLRDGDRLSVGKNVFLVRDKEGAHPVAGRIERPRSGGVIHLDEGRLLAKKIVSDPESHKAKALLKAAQLCSLVFDLDELQRRILTTLLEFIPGRRAFIFAKAEGVQGPRVQAWHARGDAQDGPAINKTMVEHVLRKKTAVLKIDGEDEDVGNGFGALNDPLRRGAMCFPLIGRKQCVGAVYLDSGYDPARFDDDDLELGTAVGQVVGVAIESARRLAVERRLNRAGAFEEAAARLGEDLNAVVSNIRASARRLEQARESRDISPLLNVWPEFRCSIERAERLSDNLLAYGRTNGVEPTPINVSAIVGQCVEAVRERAARLRVRLAFQANGRAVAYADPRDVKRLADNLVSRALDACEAKGGGTVTVRADNRLDGCRIEVEDSGAGIPAQDAPKAPEDFTFTSRVGLPLAVSYKIARDNGGYIRVKSDETAGTTITVVLPQQPGAELADTLGM